MSQIQIQTQTQTHEEQWNNQEMTDFFVKIEEAIIAKKKVTLTPRENELYESYLEYLTKKVDDNVYDSHRDWKEILEEYIGDYKKGVISQDS